LRQKQRARRISRCVPKMTMTNEAAEAITRSGAGLSGCWMARRLKLRATLTYNPKLKIRKGKLSSIFHRKVEPLTLTATHRLYRRATVQTSVTNVISKQRAAKAQIVFDNRGDSTEQ